LSILRFLNSMSLLLLFALPKFQTAPHREEFALQTRNLAPSFGTVQGQVVDEVGSPLVDARVYAEPVDSGVVQSGKLRFAKTKPDGTFILEQVEVGANVICASKEQALYPDTGAAALALDYHDLPRIEVQEGKLTPSVTVRLTKGGKLTGLVLNSANGDPVQNSRIRLTRIDDPALFVSTGPDEQAHFEFVIPSKAFRLQVTAPGYKTWNSDEHGGPILIAPESTKEFRVSLQADGSALR
jgi:hypothetical protein